jgi:hypothetical protein
MKLSNEEKQALKNRAIALIRNGTGRFSSHPYQVNVKHTSVMIHHNGILIADIYPKGKESEFHAAYNIIENAMIGARKHV